MYLSKQSFNNLIYVNEKEPQKSIQFISKLISKILYSRGAKHIRSKERSKSKQDFSGLWCISEQIMNMVQSGYTVNNTGASCLIKQSCHIDCCL